MDWTALLWGMLGGAITATLIVALAVVTVRSAVRRALGPLAAFGAMQPARKAATASTAGIVFSETAPAPSSDDLKAAGLIAEDK